MKIETQNWCIVCVISHKRSDCIPAFYNKNRTYIVWYWEKEDYVKAWYPNTIEWWSLIDSRNKALEIWDKHNKMVLQLSDDLGRVKIKWKETTLDKLIKYSVDMMQRIDTTILWVNPVYNDFYSRETITNWFVIWDYTLTKPNTGIRYDTKLRLKEDYDFCLQHLKKYRNSPRMNYVLCEFKHYTNKGWAVDYRTEQLEEETCLYLLRKRHGALKQNPKRKNELLIARNATKFI